jgi:hypothetical protein
VFAAWNAAVRLTGVHRHSRIVVMFRSRWWLACLTGLALYVCGCGTTARSLALDAQLARDSLDKALQAWVEGKKPADLKPEITMGDVAWEGGKTLVSFEIKQSEEKSDGTNLYIPVVCSFKDSGGAVSKSETIYVVGTSPVITIFPQQ